MSTTGIAVLVTALSVPAAVAALTLVHIIRGAWRSFTYRGWFQR